MRAAENGHHAGELKCRHPRHQPERLELTLNVAGQGGRGQSVSYADGSVVCGRCAPDRPRASASARPADLRGLQPYTRSFGVRKFQLLANTERAVGSDAAWVKKLLLNASKPSKSVRERRRVKALRSNPPCVPRPPDRAHLYRSERSATQRHCPNESAAPGDDERRSEGRAQPAATSPP
jgi:hypothetical protein